VPACPCSSAGTTKPTLVELLNFWGSELSTAKLPAGIWDLRNALVDDLAYSSA
jgi:hypothetical protein